MVLRRPDIDVDTLRQRWETSPFRGGVLGILSVAVATAGIGALCTVIALVVALIY